MCGVSDFWRGVSDFSGGSDFLGGVVNSNFFKFKFCKVIHRKNITLSGKALIV